LFVDNKVKKREFGNLLAIPDNFPKMVISMDEITGGSYQGIQHLHIEDFLISITETTPSKSPSVIAVPDGKHLSGPKRE